MSVGLLRAPAEKMPTGGADDGARQWRALCRRLAREHRRAISQLSQREFREYMEWVAEQWELAAELIAPDVPSRLQRLIKQVASHRKMLIRLRSVRRPSRSRRVVQMPRGVE